MVRGLPTQTKTIWENLVDVNKVYAALLLLKRSNPLYSAIHLPESAKNLLDVLETSEEVEFEIQPCEVDAADRKVQQGLLIQVDPAEAESNYEQFTIYPLHKARSSSSATALYQMLKVNEAPIDSRDKQLDVKCFPDLFVNGQFGQFHSRSVPLKSADFIKTKLMSKHSRFRLNHQYLFYLLNDANIRQLSAGIFHKLNVVNPRERLTAAACLEKMSREELEGCLTTIFARLRNTEQYWVSPRNDLNCMTANYGPSTWFLTISPSDWEWEDLGQYLRYVNGTAMVNKSVSELVAYDPVSTSRFIDNKFHAMLDFLLSDDAPLGKVTHYFWRREYQGRGMQHFHVMLWVEGAPILGVSSRQEVATFITKYATCRIPDKNLCPLLHGRVMKFQKHVDNSYCMRNKKTKTGFRKVCRFGFPRPEAASLVLRDVTVSIAGRKTLKANTRLYDLPRSQAEVNVNDYNPAVLLAWNGNMDLQFIGEKTAMLNWYITKYTTKSEKSHAAEIFEEINSTKSLCSRLYNVGMRALNNRECGALEASDTLLGISLHGTDSGTTVRWLDVKMIRSRRLKPLNQLRAMEPDVTDIFFPSWVDNHYPNRPVELEDIYLYKFVKSFDIVNERPKTDKFKVYQMQGGKFLKERSRPHLVNHYKYNVSQMPEKYFFALLLMFKPWREIEELKGEHESYAQAFAACKDDLQEAMRYDKTLTDMQAANDLVREMIAFKVAEFEKDVANDDDDNNIPDNALTFNPVEVVGAMQEFRDAVCCDELPPEDVIEMVRSLNSDQRRVFDSVLETLTDDTGKKVLRHFVSGVGGFGKSHLLKTIKAWVKANLNKDVAVSAPTGIAAYNVNGLTIYRLLQLPVEHEHTPRYTELSDQVLKVIRDEMKDVILIIIDEISMVSNLTLMYIHLRLTEVFDTKDVNDGWFGRKHLLLFGDLLQLPPVHEDSPFVKLSKHDVDKYLGSLSVINLWQELFTYDELTINMRQLNDSTFIDMLGRIRLGVLTQADAKMLNARKISFSTSTHDKRLKELSKYINSLPIDAVCLLPTRHLCKVLNKAMLDTIASEEIILVAKDSLQCAQYLQKKANKCIAKLEDDSSRTGGLERTITIKITAHRHSSPTC